MCTVLGSLCTFLDGNEKANSLLVMRNEVKSGNGTLHRAYQDQGRAMCYPTIRENHKEIEY